MKKSTVEVLKKAREVIQNPENWMKGDWTNEAGTCFCALGAVAVGMGYTPVTEENIEIGIAQKIINSDANFFLKQYVRTFANTAQFNDFEDTTHADVIHMFDKAIQLATEKENNQ